MNIHKIILDEYDRQNELPFEWGKTDCFKTACAFAEKIIGRDPGSHLIYDSEMAAKRLMVENGWDNVGDLAASLFDEVPVARAQSGSWAYVEQPDNCGLGVVLGWQVLIRTQAGMGILKLQNASRAFWVY